MRLTHLEIFGFKSFLTKVEIPFGTGITAIVGPNGCGKSNIVEAIRWVLGEQRAGAVRGHRMEDVIFGGTRQRKPLGMSEVSLTIDNSSHTLPIEYSAVTVTRRLFRSGDSDYLLNKVPCRLLDIQNLLMDTGLGPGAYSVMEQGMVDEIISERTENRRRILEEAAGITKYKARRRSTWNKLESTRADLTRLEDIIAEARRQVDYLGRQVGRARRYQNLREELDELEVVYGRHRFFEIQTQLRPLREDFDELSKRSVSGLTELTALETELEKRRLAVTEAEKTLQSVGIELTRCIDQLHQRDRELVAGRERREAREQFISRAAHESAEHGRQLELCRQQQEQTRAALAAAETQLNSDAARLQEHESAVAAAETRWQTDRTVVDEGNQKLRRLLDEKGERSRGVERRRAESEAFERSRAELSAEGQVLDGDGNRQREIVLQSERECADAAARLSAVESDYDGALDRQRTVDRQLAVASEQVADLRRNVEANAARLQVLERVRSGYEGYSQGVRALMLDSRQRELFRGVLGDLIEVEPEYFRAVETALGSALQALVADSDRAAFEALRHLQDGSGRAGIFPLNWPECERPAAAAPDLPGLRGPLADRVRAEAAVQPLVDRLLHNTFVIDEIGVAVTSSPAALEPVRLVTREGEGIDFFGCLEGGTSSGDEDGGVLGRRREIARLRSAIAHDKARLASADLAFSSARSRLDVLRGYASDLDELVGELKDDHRRKELRLQEAGRERDRMTTRRVEVESNVAALSEQLSGLTASLESDGDHLLSLQSATEELEANISTAEQALLDSEQRRRSSAEALGVLRVEHARVVEQVDGGRRDAQRLSHIEQGHEQNIERLTGEVEEADCERRELIASEEGTAAEIGHMHEVREELTSNRDNSQQQWQEVVTRSRQLEGEISKLQRELSADRERRHQLELQIADLQNDGSHIRERLREELHLDVESLGPLEDEQFDADAAGERLERVRSSLERLGSVHVGVLDEYEQQKERYDFLVQQRDDLLAAAEDLRKTLQLIDRTARRIFLETFEGIREKFKETFARFFPGGEADLVLEADADPLEAGIEISARPRGKRLQNIGLLSGGEKALTAIALLFAIYQVKPSPWCILDEVDAPLDDANVDRFLRVLREFAETTQFIMVTHNKLSMTAANALHGVTMPEEGVSQLVSVEVEPELLDEAAG